MSFKCGLNLHSYCPIGYKKAVEQLIEKGANVNVTVDSTKLTPLHYLIISERWNEDDKISNFDISCIYLLQLL